MSWKSVIIILIILILVIIIITIITIMIVVVLLLPSLSSLLLLSLIIVYYCHGCYCYDDDYWCCRAGQSTADTALLKIQRAFQQLNDHEASRLQSGTVSWQGNAAHTLYQVYRAASRVCANLFRNPRTQRQSPTRFAKCLSSLLAVLSCAWWLKMLRMWWTLMGKM